MAEKKKKRIVKLSPEMKADLEKAMDDIVEAEESIKVLEVLGLDAKDLRDKLDWAKKARETLLKEFG